MDADERQQGCCSRCARTLICKGRDAADVYVSRDAERIGTDADRKTGGDAGVTAGKLKTQISTDADLKIGRDARTSARRLKKWTGTEADRKWAGKPESQQGRCDRPARRPAAGGKDAAGGREAGK